MRQYDFKVEQVYKISFLSFYIVPLIAIVVKFFYGFYQELFMEVWFLGILLISTVVFYSLTQLTKEVRRKLIHVSVSIFVLFFGLGAIGFESGYIFIDFTDTEFIFKLPYIIMFFILCSQFVVMVIIGLNRRETIEISRVTQESKITPPIYIMMGATVLTIYIVSIIAKELIGVQSNYIQFELSILSGYIVLYLGFFAIARYELKLNVPESFIQSLFFIPIMSTGLAIGVLFFKESFLLFKLTTVICGIIIILLYLLNLIIKKISD